MTESRQDAWTMARSRRSAIGAIGAATTGMALARLAVAQDATPSAATPAAGADGEKTFFLFVQTAQAGSFLPKPGEEGVYQVTLTGATAQTVYLSDRPERIVGAVPTVQFLDTLGFTPDNSPNAALVTQTDGGEEVVVIELRNPVYSEDFGVDGTVTLTYDVVVLADYQGAGLAHLAEQQGDGALPARFGHTSLFIDDCPDIKNCWGPFLVPIETVVGPVPGGPIPTCWSPRHAQCRPCNGEPLLTYGDLCNQTYPDDCGGDCFVSVL